VNTLLTDVTTGATGTGSSSILGLLNTALGSALGSTSTAGAAHPNATNLLHLSVGPVTLDLLGLVVNLDNCHGGPVTVDVTANPGPGNLLGNLLGGLAHALDGPARQTGLIAAFDQALLSYIAGL
ncbi:MAG: hypothetical protein LC745_05785, partial [Planctomycetia bacterium]|nr:hypothetical protein [Planctomycetia bacterium]